ncbi:hypothetical protein [Natronobeatus ordinarius]|uniref:hypothetical protein n=1 Tax=Natronobeatus ordinarius TaxID=2963433 RepID=UPI0020CD0937|nr:hypothetical protein [Natronobeatus ordinarius]
MSDESVKERIRYRQEHSVDPEAFLRDAGAIRPADGDEQLRFTSSFESRVAYHLERFRREGVDTAVVAGIFGVDEADVEAVERPYVAFKIVYTVRSWPSKGALVFDAATDATLRERSDEWSAVPPRQRYRILQSLRSFQDECFFCSGEIAFDDEPVESCCSERRVLRLYCAGCDRRFLEFAVDRATGDSVGTASGGDPSAAHD